MSDPPRDDVTTASGLESTIKRAARDAGFELAGIAPIHDVEELGYFEKWISAGYAADMHYLSARDDAGRLERSSAKIAFPWARSVIVCAINYNTAEPYSTEAHDSKHGWIARYAWGQGDYHDSVMKRLRRVEEQLLMSAPGTNTRCYVDTGPIVERVYAKYAGIGWIGKNTCILNQQLGSWLFLGVILSSVKLTPDLPAADRCGSCTRCISACPTGALIESYQLNSERCISYLTIEARGELSEKQAGWIGRHVFGCDICQDVCPWNRKAAVSHAPEFQARESLVNPALAWLAELTEAQYRERFRGSAIRRAKRTGLRRNAIIAMGNSGDRGFLSALNKIAHDEDETVAAHARSAIAKLSTTHSELTSHT